MPLENGMPPVDEWRRLIEEHFPVVKIQTMVWMAVIAAEMTVDEVLQKYDAGAYEHRNKDASKLKPLEELRGEIADCHSYVAKAILLGLQPPSAIT